MNLNIVTNLVHASSAYFRETKEELQKVTWLSRKDIIDHTLIVIVSVAIAAAFIAVVDYGLSQVIKQVVLKG